ncbi:MULTISPECIES: tannase/feruloyl esterase family alpha/beta hydrolase [unclassified Variovorax]|jgi:feruloyl esterase|uniref:tannase/feruloyl esterase family alpha/beta hydrolase n=1 Tax=unclassified Variovorax TaxID=663243 RepID=UPI000F7DE9AF|nr:MULTISPECIES: tannase/feruloyl esterase family alpha/beta hydrolase [unclassified Variovorax]RSZ39737.1 tannase/feruloyl esterase family alpha/beta hydrolase [Variovorax sp. 553]RSZ40556.1 tannase/feruloyl esterase family alpha/beta hydrolase [Variovorax sp. 679]
METTSGIKVVLRAVARFACCGLCAALVACGGGNDNTGSFLGFLPQSSPPSPSPAPAPAPAPLSCDESMKTAFRPDANTRVLLVRAFKSGEALLLSGTATGSTPVAASDMCLVKLLVGPGHAGPADAPSTTQGIGIEVWLPSPSKWNRRIHLLGGAAMAGGPQTSLASFADAPTASPWRVAGEEGAVAATTDTGHPAGNSSFLMNPDGTINTVGWNEFAERGIHEMTVKAKALAAAYFGSAARYTYWHGGSTGGRQGLKQAQKYPEDFDGIIATSPAINWSRFTIGVLYPQLVVQRDLGGVPLTSGQSTAVSMAALDACDLVGGRHLGYLLDPSQCRYDPAKDKALLCTSDGGSNATADCLTTVQATAVNKMWYGPTADGSVPDPAIDNGLGTTLSPNQLWWGLPRGASLSLVAGQAPFFIASDMTALFLQDPSRAGPTFTNATGNGASRWKDLSYAQLPDVMASGRALQPQFSDIDTDNPDLSRFRARGGKLITVVGSSDQLIPHAGVVDYYRRVAAQMGGLDAVQAFYKLYLIPGMGHFPTNGTGNAQANPPLYPEALNYQALTDWVEKGVAPPDQVVLNTPATAPAASGLMCAYPRMPAYGSGSITDAASYSCR